MPRDPYLAQLEEERRNDPDFGRKSRRWQRERDGRSSTPVIDGLWAWHKWSRTPVKMSANILPWFGALMIVLGAIALADRHQAISEYKEERKGVVRPRTEEDEREWRRVNGYPSGNSPRRHGSSPEYFLIAGAMFMITGFWRKIKYSRDRYLEQIKHGDDAVVEPFAIKDPFLDQVAKDNANDPSIRS